MLGDDGGAFESHAGFEIKAPIDWGVGEFAQGYIINLPCTEWFYGGAL